MFDTRASILLTAAVWVFRNSLYRCRGDAMAAGWRLPARTLYAHTGKHAGNNLTDTNEFKTNTKVEALAEDGRPPAAEWHPNTTYTHTSRSKMSPKGCT